MNSTIISSSSLRSSANNIVKVSTRSQGSVRGIIEEYQKFSNFLEVKTSELEKTEFPKIKEIKDLFKVDVLTSMGSLGGLISSFVGGAIDFGGLVRGIFRGKDKKIGAPLNVAEQRPVIKPSDVKPKLNKGNLRFGGVRAVGITNALFTGLDFASGIAEGESTGKAAAGAIGSLAGSLLSGAIGQTLIPIPGVGFVIGSMVGGFLGGWAADRAYDAVSSISGSLSSKQRERIEKSKKDNPDAIRDENERRQKDLLSKFDRSVISFGKFIDDLLEGKITLDGSSPTEEESGQQNNSDPSSPLDEGDPNLIVEGGTKPSELVVTSGIGAGRDHKGIDYDMREGTPISIIKRGTVARVDYDPRGYGNYVVINHGNGVETLYAHLKSVNVRQGDTVEPGAVIGFSGNTGRSSDPHLHFEIIRNGSKDLRINGSSGDPFFRAGGNVRVRPRPQPNAAAAPSSGSSNPQPAAPTNTAAAAAGSGAPSPQSQPAAAAAPAPLPSQLVAATPQPTPQPQPAATGTPRPVTAPVLPTSTQPEGTGTGIPEIVVAAAAMAAFSNQGGSAPPSSEAPLPVSNGGSASLTNLNPSVPNIITLNLMFT